MAEPAPIVVIGDCLVDEYYDVERIKPSPEHEGVCLVNPRLTRRVPGGAAHVAMSLARMGMPTILLGVLHDEAIAEALSAEPGLVPSFSCGRDPAGQPPPTCIKRRYQYRGQMLMRCDDDPERPRYLFWRERLHRLLPELLTRCSAVVTSDYDKGTLSASMLDTIRMSNPPIWVVDPKRRFYDAYHHPRLVFKPNASEALTFSGALSCGQAVTTLAHHTGGSVVVTAGEHGIWYGTTDYVDHHPAHPLTPQSVVGAGDTATAVLAAGLSRGWSLPQAVRACAEACAHVVTQPGTTPLDADTWRRVVDLIEVT